MSDSLMTPRWVFSALVASWGRCALDPCWHPESPVEAQRLLEPSEDGLTASWFSPGWGWVFLNPPYSDVGPWLARGLDEGVRFAALLKFDPTTRWYRDYVRDMADVGIFQTRLKYARTDGGKQYCANFTSCLCLYDLPRPTEGLSLDWIERSRV